MYDIFIIFSNTMNESITRFPLSNQTKHEKNEKHKLISATTMLLCKYEREVY